MCTLDAPLPERAEPFPGLGPYAATKSALNTPTDVARVELARDHITVSLIVPAVVDTPSHDVLRAGKAVLRVVETGEPEISVMPQAS